MKSPLPEKVWYGNDWDENNPGYLSNPDKEKALGIGNLFVQPSRNTPEQLELLVFIDVNDHIPTTVSRISTREVSFGDWQVTFSPDEKFNVVNSWP